MPVATRKFRKAAASESGPGVGSLPFLHCPVASRQWTRDTAWQSYQAAASHVTLGSSYCGLRLVSEPWRVPFLSQKICAIMQRSSFSLPDEMPGHDSATLVWRYWAALSGPNF